MEVQGTFNAQQFFDTLARIISNKEKMQVTVKVTKKDEAGTKNESEMKTA